MKPSNELEMYVIKKDVPIKERKYCSKYAEIARQMSPGDCVTVKNAKEVYNISYHLRKRKLKAIARKTGNNITIWCVEKK